MDPTTYLVSPFFSNIAVILLMVCPAISMRLFSDELKNRTMELLFTSPVSTAEIVLGKFLGALGFVAILLAGTAYVPFTLWMWGQPDWGVFAGGYLSVFLLSGAMLAMGGLFSAFTPNAMVAMISTFAGGLGLWLISWQAEGGSDGWAAQLSIVTHLEDFLRGVIVLTDVTYYLAFILFFLFATHQRVEAYRWR
jgi:ABC-2 type transport system permease protein